MNESYHIMMKGQPGQGIVGYSKLSMVIDKILRLQAEAGIDPKELEKELDLKIKKALENPLSGLK